MQPLFMRRQKIVCVQEAFDFSALEGQARTISGLIRPGLSLSLSRALSASALVQGSLLFVTYTIIQGIISSEM